jgi:predicted DNA-binding transcriptional regulator AlpA
MTTITLEEVASELKAIREFMASIGDRHLDRHEFAERLGVSVDTLDRRVKSGAAPPPLHGKWPLSVIVEWERSTASKQSAKRSG